MAHRLGQQPCLKPVRPRFASVGHDRTIKIREADNAQKLVIFTGHSGVTLSTDDKQIFAEDKNGKIFAWNTNTVQLLHETPQAMPDPAINTSPDGKLCLGIDNGIPSSNVLTIVGRMA